MTNKNIKRCKKGVWDTTIPDISFDSEGISNYYYNLKKLDSVFPIGEKGRSKWLQTLSIIKKKNKNNKYNCIIGISGGTDSSYLLHLAKKVWGLRPLAVNLDNGWSNKIAVTNIKKVTSKLNIDLETYVIDYDEVKQVLLAFMRAGIPWIDGPTDIAIKSILYKIAARENIKTILVGSDFKSEGKQPTEWTYGDDKMFNYIIKSFSKRKLKTYPNMSIYELIYCSVIKRIKQYQPFYFINYSKSEAQNVLMDKYGWEYYGGHHHENIFTKFAIAYWLPRKFNIDKILKEIFHQVFFKI